MGRSRRLFCRRQCRRRFGMPEPTDDAYGIRTSTSSTTSSSPDRCPTRRGTRVRRAASLFRGSRRSMRTIATELKVDFRSSLIRRRSRPSGLDLRIGRLPVSLMNFGDFQRVIDESSCGKAGSNSSWPRRARARQSGKLLRRRAMPSSSSPWSPIVDAYSTLKTEAERERAGQKDGAIAAATVNIDPLGSISVMAHRCRRAKATRPLSRRSLPTSLA